MLRGALALWRGAALSGYEDVEPLAPEARRLEQARLQAEEDLLEERLVLGEHGVATADAACLVDEEPLRERRTALLVLALYRSGRQAEALAAAARLRVRLATELGIDPSPELQRMEGKILRQVPSLDWRPVSPSVNGATGDRPRRGLPRALKDLVIQRTGDLPPEAMRLLYVLCLLGRPGSADELARISGTSADDVDSLLTMARRAGVLADDVADVPLRRPQVADALLDGVEAGERRRLERSVGEALAGSARADAPVAAAWHLVRAVPVVAPEDAARAAVLGVDACLRGHDAAAAEALARAALAVQDVPPASSGPSIDLLLRLSVAEARLDNLPEAEAVWGTALTAARARGDVERIALCVLAHEWTRRAVTADADDRDLLRDTLELLGPRPSALRIRVASALLTECAVPGRTLDVDELADEVVEAAPTVGDDVALLAGLHAQHVLLRSSPDPTVRRAIARRLREVAERTADDPWWKAVAVLAELYDALTDADGAAVPGLAALFAECVARADNSRLAWHLELTRAALGQLRGDWADADRHADEAAVSGAAAGISDAVAAAVVHRYLHLLHTGSVASLTELLDGYVAVQPRNLLALGAAALAVAKSGRPRDAARFVDCVVDGVHDAPRDEAGPLAVALAAAAATTVGAGADVRRALADLLGPRSGQVIVFGQVTAVFGPVDRVLALLAAADGDDARAQSLTARAASTSERLRSPLWELRCGADRALMHHRAGRTDIARELAVSLARRAEDLSLRPVPGRPARRRARAGVGQEPLPGRFAPALRTASTVLPHRRAVSSMGAGATDTYGGAWQVLFGNGGMRPVPDHDGPHRRVLGGRAWAETDQCAVAPRLPRSCPTRGRFAVLTQDPSDFQGRLRPGDVLTFDSTGFDAGLVQWADRVPVSHAAIVLDATHLVEANKGPRPVREVDPADPGQAVRTVLTAGRLANPAVRTVTALRHTGLHGDVERERLLARTRVYLERGGDFAYLHLVALGALALRRSYSPDERAGLRPGLLDYLVDKLVDGVQRVTGTGAWNLSCRSSSTAASPRQGSTSP